MLQIALLDDDEVFLRELRQRVAEEMRARDQEVALYTFHSCAEILMWISEIDSLDIAILDIDMGPNRYTGIDVAVEVRRRFSGCGIIYLTAYLEFVTSVFETKPLYFITKQELDIRLRKALDMFFTEYASGTKYISVRFGKMTTVLATTDILYCERVHRKTRIVTTHGETVTSEGLTELRKQLPQERFAACHNSYLVNLDRLNGYDRQFVSMANGDLIPISRAGRQELMDKIADYLRGRLSNT